MPRPKELATDCGDCLLFGAIQGLHDGLILLDLEDRVFHVNRRAQEILDLGSRHVVGGKLPHCLSHLGLDSFWKAALHEEVPVATELALPGGTQIRVSVTLCLSTTHEPIGRAIQIRDVTREKMVQVELSDSVARRLVEMAAPPPPPQGLPQLTGRESEILRLLVEGLSNSQIADHLHLSVNTVASHLKNIYPKLNVSSRAQAAAFAVAHGILPTGR